MSRNIFDVILSFVVITQMGCGGGAASFEGEWSADSDELQSSMRADLEDETAADESTTEDRKKRIMMIEAVVEFVGKIVLNIKLDGTFNLDMMGHSDTTSGTWKAEKNSITLTDSEGVAEAYHFKGDRLVMILHAGSGVQEKLYMVRKAK